MIVLVVASLYQTEGCVQAQLGTATAFSYRSLRERPKIGFLLRLRLECQFDDW